METLDLLKQLEINYKLMSNDLEFSSHALDSLLKAAARANSSFPDLHALPCRIGALRASIDALATDAAEIIREGKEAAPGLKDAMLKNYTVMVGLYSRLGVAPDPDWVAVADELKHITPGWNLSARQEKRAWKKRLHERKITPMHVQGSRKGKRVESREKGASQHQGLVNVMTRVLLPRRKDRGWDSILQSFVLHACGAVSSEEDFLAVPSTTRGRARLQDVRKVYAKIRESCEEKSSRDRPGCKPRTISKKELGAAGFKVFGLTGDCTLNTLRAMGLVKVTRTGITLVSATS